MNQINRIEIILYEALVHSRDLTMKFWRLMVFIATGDPAVRGHAWNFFSVSSHQSLLTVFGVLPEVSFKKLKKKKNKEKYSINHCNSKVLKLMKPEDPNLPPNSFFSAISRSHAYANPNDPATPAIILAAMLKLQQLRKVPNIIREKELWSHITKVRTHQTHVYPAIGN